MALNGTTVIANRSVVGLAGGICNNGTMSVSGGSITGNAIGSDGGGLFNNAEGTLTAACSAPPTRIHDAVIVVASDRCEARCPV